MELEGGRRLPGAALRRLPRRPALARSGAAALLAAALACAGPPPPPPAPPVADFESPRPALVASFLRISLQRETRGDLEGALRAAEQAREAGPESPAARLREAELQAAIARRARDEAGLAAASAAVDALAEAHPETPEPRLAAARIALADGRVEEAAQAARALAEERPEWAGPHVVLSRTLIEEDPAGALTEAERAVSLAPADADALSARAAARLAFAQDRGAEMDARRVLRMRRDPEVSRILAAAELRAGKLRPAIATAESVLEAERSVALELVLVRAKWDSAARDGAREALARAKLRAGDDAQALGDVLDLGLTIAQLEGRIPGALAEIETARRAHPDDARLAELAALGEAVQKRMPAAEANARRALELDAGRLPAWQLLATLLEEAGAKLPAQERAAAALGTGADDARAHALAGLVAERLGDPAAARGAYEAALARDPTLYAAQLQLARLLALEGRDAGRAVSLAEACVAERGWSFQAAETLGSARLAAGLPADAVTAFRLALGTLPQLEGEAESVILQLATALAAEGQDREARSLVGALVRSAEKREPAPAWLPEAQALHKRLADGAGSAPAAAR